MDCGRDEASMERLTLSPTRPLSQTPAPASPTDSHASEGGAARGMGGGGIAKGAPRAGPRGSKEITSGCGGL